MIRVASFKIPDADGINALLENSASLPAPISSFPRVNYAFKDGTEPNNEQKAIELLEQKNIMLKRLAFNLEHGT